MELASEDTHRLLAYIEALERQGYRPTRSEVAVYADKPTPLPPVMRGGIGSKVLINRAALSALFGETVKPAEGIVAYMQRSAGSKCMSKTTQWN